MKTAATFLLAIAFAMPAMAQILPVQPEKHLVKDTLDPVAHHSVLLTGGVGMGNSYRSSYSVPTGFQKNNTTGFLPVYLRAEYISGKHMGVSATMIYNNFYGNFYQQFVSNGKTYSRSKTDQVEIYAGGLALNYHFGSIIPVKKLDVFITGGFLANTIHHSALAKGDSVTSLTDRTVTPVLRAGARYYIANASSIFLDAGYDKHSVVSIGYSCCFVMKHAH